MEMEGFHSSSDSGSDNGRSVHVHHHHHHNSPFHNHHNSPFHHRRHRRHYQHRPAPPVPIVHTEHVCPHCDEPVPSSIAPGIYKCTKCEEKMSVHYGARRRGLYWILAGFAVLVPFFLYLLISGIPKLMGLGLAPGTTIVFYTNIITNYQDYTTWEPWMSRERPSLESVILPFAAPLIGILPAAPLILWGIRIRALPNARPVNVQPPTQIPTVTTSIAPPSIPAQQTVLPPPAHVQQAPYAPAMAGQDYRNSEPPPPDYADAVR